MQPPRESRSESKVLARAEQAEHAGARPHRHISRFEKMKPLLSECRTDVSASLATSSLGEFFQVSDGQVLRMRSQRALMETTQLNEERILSLAHAQVPEAKGVA